MFQVLRAASAGAALTLLAGCSTSPDTVGSGPAAPPPSEPLPLTSVSTSSREAVAARYRLAPDRRFLLAAADLDRLLGGSGEPLRAEWQGGQWKLSQGGREVGGLPELPSYADAVRWLDDWATVRARGTAPGGEARAALEPLPSIVDAAALARAAGARFGAGDRKAVGDGAHALSALALQIDDPMGRNPGLPSRALALVVTARAFGVLSAADEVLVAAALGYRSAARSIANTLPENDPVRAYALGEDGALEGMKSPSAKRLRLRRFVERHDRIGALRWIRHELHHQTLELDTLSARLELQSFDDIAKVAVAMPGLLALHAEREMAPPGSVVHRLITSQNLETVLSAIARDERPVFARLETALEALPDDAALGVFLKGEAPGADLWREAYRSLGYAAIHSLGVWTVMQQASLPRADALARAIALAGGASFADGGKWLTLYRSAAEGRTRPKELAQSIAALPFSDRAVQAVLDEAMRGASYGAFEALPLARAIVRRLDTRVEHRAFWGQVSRELLLDLVQGERLSRSAVAENPERYWWTRLHLASLDGSLPELRPQLADSSLPESDRLELLEWLARQHLITAPELNTELERLHAERRWATAGRFVELLEERGDSAGARNLARAFLKSGDPEGLNTVAAQTAISRTFAREKRYEEAWRAVEPAMESHQERALHQGALSLLALGQREEAVAHATRASKRYPTSAESVGVVAELHWRSGSHAQAATLLAQPPHPLNNLEWRWKIGPHFVSAVQAGADPRAMFAELVLAKIDPLLLRGVLNALGQVAEKQRASDAVELYRALRAPGMEQLELLTEAAQIVQRTEGADAASAFLRENTPPKLKAPLVQFAFARGLYDALWSVAPLHVGRVDHDACNWLFRAGASLRIGNQDPHRAELIRHFNTEVPSHYHTLGRHLLGLADERAALGVAKKPHDVPEVAYWVGLEADSERRIDDAVAWYRVAIEADMPQVYESRLAFERLAEWRQSGKSLRRLAD